MTGIIKLLAADFVEKMEAISIERKEVDGITKVIFKTKRFVVSTYPYEKTTVFIIVRKGVGSAMRFIVTEEGVMERIGKFATPMRPVEKRHGRLSPMDELRNLLCEPYLEEQELSERIVNFIAEQERELKMRPKRC